MFDQHKPRKGDLVTFKGEPAGYVVRVEGNLCWHDAMGRTDDGAGLFIWCFHDGVNAMHDWPTRKGARMGRCPGLTEEGDIAP